MAIEQQPPIVLAMVLADTVLVDVATGRNTIQGTYQTLTSQDFPFQLPMLVVYFAFTDGYGDTRLTFRLTDVEEARPPVFEVAAIIPFDGPLDIAEYVFCEADVVFPDSGEYRLEIYCGEEHVFGRRIEVWSADHQS